MRARLTSPRWAAPVAMGKAVGVVARSGLSGRPKSFLRDQQEWPSGELQPGAPVTVVYTQAIVRALEAAITGRGWSNTEAAAQIGVSRQSLQRILAGDVVPDLHTLARAESVMGVTLWPQGLH